jgi:hypothetical protein
MEISSANALTTMYLNMLFIGCLSFFIDFVVDRRKDPGRRTHEPVAARLRAWLVCTAVAKKGEPNFVRAMDPIRRGDRSLDD